MAWLHVCSFLLERLDFNKWMVVLTLIVLSLLKDTATGQDPLSTSSNKQEISPSFVDTRRDIEVLQSGMAILPCAVRNLGDRQVVWRRLKSDEFLTIGAMVWTKDHRVIVDYYVEDDGTTAWDLIIRNAQFSDTGVYECQITSIEFLTRNVDLKVLEKPTSNSRSTHLTSTTLAPTQGMELASADHGRYRPHQKEMVTSGKPIRLTCNTSLGNSSVPTKSLEWLKDGKDIHSNKHILLTRYQFETDRMYVSELMIDRASISDTGEYKCRLGSDVLYVFKILVVPKTKTRSRKDHANAHYYATKVKVLNSDKSKEGAGCRLAPSGNCVFICLFAFVCLFWKWPSPHSILLIELYQDQMS